MKKIEVELRSFVSQEKYAELLGYFKKNAEFVKEDYQETYYFNGEQDLRIQKNDYYTKIWLKDGKIHDEAREEIEIKFDKEQFEEAEKLFLALGYKVKIKWVRKRFEFDWDGVKVDLDYSKGYGFIIELEILTDEKGKEEALKRLKTKFKELKIRSTDREEFEKKFKDYEKNWETLIVKDKLGLVDTI